MKLSVCNECGQPFDYTGYDTCPECKTDTFIKLGNDNEKANNKDGQRKEGVKSNEGI